MNEPNEEWEKQTGDLWAASNDGDKLEGAVISTEGEADSMQYVIEYGDGKQVTTPRHTMLCTLMKDVKVGDVVRIIYKGEKSTGKGNPLKLYEVYKKRKQEGQ